MNSSASQAPEASVVIAYYKNQSTLGAQLAALSAQTNDSEFEVIIADNEGSNDLPGLVHQFDGQLSLRLIDASDARGQCHARNEGVRHSNSKFVAFCDADDEVGPNWLEALLAVLRTQDAVATGPMRLDRLNDEYVWRANQGLDDDAVVPRPVQQEPFEFLGYLPFVLGCNFAMRRESYLRIGGFDETMLGGSEDVDISWRAQEAGIPIVVASDAVVDYRMRTEPRDVLRQRMGYQRSQMHLWSLSQKLGRPVNEKSFRWTILETAKLPRKWWSVRRAGKSEHYRLALWSGSILGAFLGHADIEMQHLRARLTPSESSSRPGTSG